MKICFVCKDYKDKSVQGSLTVESSLVLSVMLLIFFCLMYPFFIFSIQMRLQSAMENTCSQQAAYAYIQQNNTNSQLSDTALGKTLDQLTSLGIGVTYTALSVESQVGRENLNKSCISDGSRGISFANSSFMENDKIDLIVNYQVRLPFPVKNEINFVQRSIRRIWVGKDGFSEDNETEEEYVYVTENGTVYHLYEDCTHIKLSIKTIQYEVLENERNTGGGIYYPCEICKPDSGGNVFITEDGNRYHKDDKCSGLKRTVKKIPQSEAGNRALCTRCGQRMGKESE